MSKQKNKKDNELFFSNGKKVNKTSVTENWLEKVDNFINDSETIYDSNEKIFYIFEKNMKKALRNHQFGYDPQYYPSSKTLLIKDKKIDNKTGKLNNVFILKEVDYEIGISFYRKIHETNILEVLIGIKMELIMKLIKEKKPDDNKSLLKIRASIGQLRVKSTNPNKLINSATFPALLNLICIIGEILDITFTKLNCKKWSNSLSNDLLDEFDFFIANKLKKLPCNSNNKIDNVFKSLKGLRNLFIHYPEFKKAEKDKNKYLLLRTVYWGNSLYVIVIKNFLSIQIYQYEIDNLLKVIKESLLTILK